jgi:hypothetical protein
MAGVHKTFNDLQIKANPQTFLYNEWLAFLCMKNYLELFYQEIPFEDVKIILQHINSVKPHKDNKEWQHWLSCINYVTTHEDNITG